MAVEVKDNSIRNLGKGKTNISANSKILPHIYTDSQSIPYTWIHSSMSSKSRLNTPSWYVVTCGKFAKYVCLNFI